MTAESRLVLVGEAIKAALDGRTQAWLAEALGVDAATVTRIVTGQQRELTLERVRQIEECLGLPLGALLRAGGYVDPGESTTDVIRRDLRLPADARRGLLALYDSYLKR